MTPCRNHQHISTSNRYSTGPDNITHSRWKWHKSFKERRTKRVSTVPSHRLPSMWCSIGKVDSEESQQFLSNTTESGVPTAKLCTVVFRSMVRKLCDDDRIVFFHTATILQCNLPDQQSFFFTSMVRKCCQLRQKRLFKQPLICILTYEARDVST